MSDPIVNKVTESGLITVDPGDYFPRESAALFDLKDFLFMGLILKEKEYREALKTHEWERYSGKNVAITCSADAIIPVWAYMLPAVYLAPVAANYVVGDEAQLSRTLFLRNLSRINLDELVDKRVVIKGCGDAPIGEYAYLELTKLLMPVVKSLMYGEPCSTVPVYKKK